MRMLTDLKEVELLFLKEINRLKLSIVQLEAELRNKYAMSSGSDLKMTPLRTKEGIFHPHPDAEKPRTDPGL